MNERIKITKTKTDAYEGNFYHPLENDNSYMHINNVAVLNMTKE